MHVLYFHQYFNTPKAGGPLRSYMFARKLIERGHTVTMVSVYHPLNAGESEDFSPTKPYHKTVDGINLILLPLRYSNYDGFLKRSITFLKFAIQSVLIALKHDYDLLFATSTPLTVSIPGIFAKVLRRKPFVFEVRDLWPELPREMGVIKNPIVLWLMGILEWSSYHTSTSAIGLSPGIVKGIKRRSSPTLNVALIPNGCDLNLHKPRSAEKQTVPGLNEDDFVAVFTGAHGIANGLDAVLNAAKILKDRKQSNIKLVFIGDGKLKPQLQMRARDEKLENCVFLDQMLKEKLAELMGSVDIGLMILANVPAFYYGTSPNKFFDYISTGLPVINNYPGWLADMITEYECGISVPPENPEAFADALIELANDPRKRKTMGINARKLAEVKFNRDDLSNQFVDFLEKTYGKN